jgi:hypothetical protein
MLKNALLRILRPIAAWCVKHGLKQQDFNELGKRAFILAASEELERSGQKHSTSRISAMTGLQRKDIARLNQTTTDDLAQPHLMAKIIGRWTSSSNYLTKKGKAKVLGLDEFTTLVQSVSSDLNPYTALFELERTGALTKKDNRLRLASEAFCTSEDVEPKLSLMAEDVGILIEAVDQNAFDQQELPNLHIKTYYDNICQKDVPQIRTWILKTGERYHKEIRDFLSKFDKDLNPTQHHEAGGVTVTVGSFSQVKLPDSPEND